MLGIQILVYWLIWATQNNWRCWRKKTKSVWRFFFLKKMASCSLGPLPTRWQKFRNIFKVFCWSHLGERVAILTEKTLEPKFWRRIRKMKRMAEGSKHFLRGFKNPLLSLCRIFFLLNASANPCFYVHRKIILSCLLNGQITRPEKILYYFL